MEYILIYDSFTRLGLYSRVPIFKGNQHLKIKQFYFIYTIVCTHVVAYFRFFLGSYLDNSLPSEISL